MKFDAALAALEARQETRIELGLERVRKHLALLGSPQERLRCFHVAGTNGKGSVCAILEATLRAAGYKTGLYTSPHLSDVRVRARVDGVPIARESFALLLEAALHADKDRRLTYFELLTSIAFQWFAQEGCEAVVLETGLGGRLDATNIIERPLVSVITSIDFDHMQFLGPTLRSIALEKAGIIKPGRPVVVGALPPTARAVVRARARETGSRVLAPRPFKTGSIDWNGGRQKVGGAWLSLLGARQGANAAVARAALDACAPELEVSSAAWKKGLARVRWPARFEPFAVGSKRVIFDGAHNPQAARALAETWKASPWSRAPARWIVGIMRDKDVSAVLAPLAPFLKDVVCVRPDNPRALEVSKLAAAVKKAAPRAAVSVAEDPKDALDAWKRDRRGPAVAVVAGSFYLVGRAREILGACDD